MEQVKRILGDILAWRTLDCEPEGREGREDLRKGKMVGLIQSVAKPELAVGAARGRDMWRNLVLGGRKPWYSGGSLDGWMNE
jgi:hypothetical protein